MIKTGRRPGDKIVPEPQASWQEYKGNVFRCMVYLTPEEDGRISVVAAHLVGAASQGDTESEALDNITEALKGLVEAYIEENQSIPWLRDALPKSDPRTKERWVIIHA